ncbi:hypothetical protein DB30_02865 [Enhygromyxa salina]|uniref:Uncharacterized protein n=1 Tax=Enhygromyxa salina TaxID=215803 RepID=A0A0C1Z2L9_9BACT|nr:hypothetical protein [Enhygromyxa salina]KIG11684.1 hypothetical protein DB30_02865 [Enhygromyxa salina]
MMRDHCQFTTRPADSLESALDAFGPLEHWPTTTTIRWTADAKRWLGPNASPQAQTQLSADLIEASVANIVVHTPGPNAPSICERRVEFDAELDIRTSDGIVNARARGRLDARRPATTAQLRMQIQPLTDTASAISISLELPHATEGSAKVELLGHESRTGTGHNGRGFAAGGEFVLGSSAL